MKVFVQIVDALTGTDQHGCIEQPIKEGFEVQHALSMFGESTAKVDWNTFQYPSKHSRMPNVTVKTGQIEGTYKFISITTLN